LLPQNSENRKQLISVLAEDVPTYNTIRPQFSLEGNTPTETFKGKIIDLKSYKSHFEEQKRWRVMLNHQNKYKNY
jgi:hypothetical protein